MPYTRRNVLMGASALLAAPWLEQFALSETHASATAKSVKDPLSYVNPEFRAALRGRHADQSLDAHLLKLARAREDSMPPAPLLPGVTKHMVPGAKGAPDVRVYVVGDSPGASKPAVLHIHGGGYILMSGAITPAETELAKELDCVVVSVDYRLAPETKFPGSLEDNYAALRWMNENAKQLGIDTSRIAVKGESAGGGHAAMIAIAVRDRKEFSFCKQILVYPMLDDRTGSTRAVPPYLGHYMWTPQSNRLGWTSLLGVPAGSKTVPPNSVPARVKDLAGLAPAFIGVGSIDLFAPEDIEYARRLLESGISTELMVIPGAYHAFDLLCPDAPLTLEFKAAWTSALRRAFARSSAL
ncbi:MAG: alpha/beta hydrolase [Acidobacteriota bacterium]